jgi:hypothetical protein
MKATRELTGFTGFGMEGDAVRDQGVPVGVVRPFLSNIVWRQCPMRL